MSCLRDKKPQFPQSHQRNAMVTIPFSSFSFSVRASFMTYRRDVDRVSAKNNIYGSALLLREIFPKTHQRFIGKLRFFFFLSPILWKIVANDFYSTVTSFMDLQKSKRIVCDLVETLAHKIIIRYTDFDLCVNFQFVRSQCKLSSQTDACLSCDCENKLISVESIK